MIGRLLGKLGLGPFGPRRFRQQQQPPQPQGGRVGGSSFQRPSQSRSSTNTAGHLQASAARPSGAGRGWPMMPMVAAGVGTVAVAGAGIALVPQRIVQDLSQDLVQSDHLEPMQKLVGSGTVQSLLTSSELLSESSPVGKDHLFTNLLRNNMVNDIHCFFDPEKQQFHSLIGLSSDVCGHPSIVHGGLTAAIMDDAFGALIFCMKKWKLMGPGPPFTVKLEVQYLSPVKAGATVVCSTKIDRIEGRKIWVTAEVIDSTSKVAYASGSALFVEPKIRAQPEAMDDASSALPMGKDS